MGLCLVDHLKAFTLWLKRLYIILALLILMQARGYAVSQDGVCTAMIAGCTWTDILEAIRDTESQEESNNARASYEYWGRAIGDIDADGEPAF